MGIISRLLFVSVISVLLFGCRIEVVVESVGGSVITEIGKIGSGQAFSIEQCGEGQVCVYDIDRTDFQASFYAIPTRGWLFAGWAGGEVSLCSETAADMCRVDLSQLAADDAQAIIDTAETSYLRPIFEPVTVNKTIMVRRREWYQPSLFTNNTWKYIADLCPEGYCTGWLNGHDLTGWTWATVNDINRLFDYYLGEKTLGFGPDSVSLKSNRDKDAFAKAAAFFGGGGWAPIDSFYAIPPGFGLTNRLYGWTRNQRLLFPEEAWVAYVGEHRMNYIDIDDGITLRTNLPKPWYVNGDGAWFYRDM